jgi:hypothetical protein
MVEEEEEEEEEEIKHVVVRAKFAGMPLESEHPLSAVE